MQPWIKITGLAVICSTWGLMLAWTGLALLNWCVSRADSSIHQCVLAAQSCAYLIAGYVIARGVSSITEKVEAFFDE